ncbi:hypothetical protein JVU11DRAFT_10503 [Chiua virens]|nr:hypothetical protein JVU11DRAFT_10500 [Chiua virens]KAG9309529.1 hypothetical protein JVU11DRAFT_10503 [Chiua virens]
MAAHLSLSGAQAALMLPELTSSSPHLLFQSSFSSPQPFSSSLPLQSHSLAQPPSLSPPTFPFPSLPPSPSSSITSPLPSLSSSPTPTSSPAPTILASLYRPRPSHTFTETKRDQGLHKVNHEKVAHHVVEHPRDAIVEYPETGSELGISVAHIFNINPDCFHDPRFNFQYSLGDGHGRGLRYCSFRPYIASPHWFVTREEVLLHTTALHAAASSPTDNAHVEVFHKTLGFYCALIKKGCAFSSADDFPDSSDTVKQENKSPLALCTKELSMRKRRTPKCNSRLELLYDGYNQPYIQCSQHLINPTRAHLLLRNLQEFDTNYLHALLLGDSTCYLHTENVFKTLGVGPLAPCTFAASPSEQKSNCPHWHRDRNNKLQRGNLQCAESCPTKYDIYTPNDLQDCPCIVIVSTNPHNHPPPLPIKTPPQLVSCLEALLLRLDWKLADATPRRLALDSGFVCSLRHALAWSLPEWDPSSHDLHPSLGNLDHLRRIINNSWMTSFPQGTGFHGALQQVGEHEKLPRDHRYLRLVERYQLPNGDDFLLVICMTARMSSLLVLAK